MIKVTTTWTGDADKLIVDGKFYRNSFLDDEDERAYLNGAVGRIGERSIEVLSDRVVIVDCFDTMENAVAFVESHRNWECFTRGPIGISEEGEYRHAHGLTSTSVTTVED